MDVQFDEEELEDLEARVTGLWLDDLFAVHQRAQERKIPQPRPPRPTIIRAKDDIEKAADKLRAKWAEDIGRCVREGSRLRYSRLDAERLFSELQSPSGKALLPDGPARAPFVVERVRKRPAARMAAARQHGYRAKESPKDVTAAHGGGL